MPRRSRYIVALGALQVRLGNTHFERYERVRSADGRSQERRHIGFRWPCDCNAFARDDGRYLWVPCARHVALIASSPGDAFG